MDMLTRLDNILALITLFAAAYWLAAKPLYVKYGHLLRRENDAPNVAFARAEQPLEQPPNDAEHAAVPSLNDVEHTGKVDAVARLLAAGKLGEASLIETVFDVKRGSSKAYTQVRDEVRAAAVGYGWQQPAPPPEPEQRVIRVNGKDEIAV